MNAWNHFCITNSTNILIVFYLDRRISRVSHFFESLIFVLNLFGISIWFLGLFEPINYCYSLSICIYFLLFFFPSSNFLELSKDTLILKSYFLFSANADCTSRHSIWYSPEDCSIDSFFFAKILNKYFDDWFTAHINSLQHHYECLKPFLYHQFH